jgi:hypothetical protein
MRFLVAVVPIFTEGRKTMAKKTTSARQMSARQLATEACDQGFQDGVRKMVEILLQGSTTPTEHKQAMQRFRKGLGIYKAYVNAQQAVAEVFSGA